MTFEDSMHNVLLSGSEISSILYALEGWIKDNDEYKEGWDNTSKGGDLSLDIDNVFTALEEVADSWQGEFADPKVLEIEPPVVNTFADDDYASKVDTLVDNMVASDDNLFTHDSEGC